MCQISGLYFANFDSRTGLDSADIRRLRNRFDCL
jgi:hypothetical protein